MADFFIHPELRKNPDVLHRARVLVLLMVAEISLYIALLVVLVLAPSVRDAFGFALPISLGSAVAIAYSFYVLKRQANYAAACLLTIGQGFVVVVVVTVLTGGTYESPAAQLLSAPCLMAFFFGGLRWGVVASCISFFIIVLITLMQALGFGFPQMTPANVLLYRQSLVLPINLAFMTTLSMIFELTYLSVKRERDREHQKFLALARIDPLTGLANRRIFDETLAARIALYSKLTPARCFALCYVDLDKFKPINDEFGHDVGDEVLNAISTRLRSALRGADFIGRQGGDEFLILLDTVQDTAAAAALAKRFLELLAEPLDTSAGAMQVGSSFGFALFPQHGTDTATLQKAADAAMYEAKKSRAGYHIFTKDPSTP